MQTETATDPEYGTTQSTTGSNIDAPAISRAHRVLLQFSNSVVFLLCFANQLYTVGVGHNIHYTGRSTYVSPAPWVFNIWTIIHVLILGTIILQFFPSGQTSIVEGIGWRLPLLGILNIIYIHVWTSGEHHLATLVLNVIISWIIVWIVSRPKRHPFPSVGEELFVNLPFSLYYGWMCVLWMLNGFDAFGIDASEKAGGWTKFFVFAMFWSLSASGVSNWDTKRAAITQETLMEDDMRQLSGVDLYFALPVTVSLWAITISQQSSGFVNTCSLVFAILSTVGDGLVILTYVFAGVLLWRPNWRLRRAGLVDEEVGAATSETEPLLR